MSRRVIAEGLRARSPRSSIAFALLLACGPWCGPAAAQRTLAQLTDGPEAPGWVGDFTLLAGNAVLGALTAGVLQALRGGSFQDGFARGALGGSVVYVGKRVAGERFDGAGLIGREIGAVGSSMVRNAAESQPTLSRFLLPVGPLALEVRRGQDAGVRPRVDVLTLGTVVWATLQPELELDWGSSLSAGMPVFRARGLAIAFDGASVAGVTLPGTVILADPAFFPLEGAEGIFSHERVHVVQEEFLRIAWSAPLERWLLPRVPGGAWVHRNADLNTLGLVGRVLLQGVGAATVRNFPWELEADFLGGR